MFGQTQRRETSWAREWILEIQRNRAFELIVNVSHVFHLCFIDCFIDRLYFLQFPDVALFVITLNIIVGIVFCSSGYLNPSMSVPKADIILLTRMAESHCNGKIIGNILHSYFAFFSSLPFRNYFFAFITLSRHSVYECASARSSPSPSLSHYDKSCACLDGLYFILW